MSIKYACFVSYPHSKEILMSNFMQQLKQALAASLEPYLRNEVYMDDRHIGCDNYNEGIAQAICESICMIVVFSPVYTERDFCLREFLAMEKIEEKRKQKLGEKFDRTKRMIIPIILRGDSDDLPDKIKNIHYSDFSNFSLGSMSLKRSREFQYQLDQIAKYIYEIYTDLKGLEEREITFDCDSFKLPSEKEAIDLWNFSKSSSIGFPGRKIEF